MSVAECQERVSSKEFSEWVAYSRSNPIAGLRGDIQAAILAQQLDLLVQLKTKKHGVKARDLIEFMPLQKDMRKGGKGASPEKLLAAFCNATKSVPPGKDK